MAAIEILRTGRVTDRAGNLILSVTEQLLKDVLNFFTQDPTGVPIILGHPDRYGSAEPPAFAWVKSLAIEGGKRLMATLERIDPTVQTMVNEGKFPNCSVEMEQGEGDRWQLTAIGLLGKSRPAVKGMERVKLSLLEKSKKRILLMETDGMGMDDLTAETSGFIFEHQIVDSLEALNALTPLFRRWSTRGNSLTAQSKWNRGKAIGGNLQPLDCWAKAAPQLRGWNGSSFHC